MKKITSMIIVMVLIISTSLMFAVSIQAMTKKVKISTKRIVIEKGKIKNIKLKNVGKKVKWSVKNKKIVTIKKIKGKHKNTVAVEALKLGNTIVIAKYKGKKYKTKVMVIVKAKKQTSKSIMPETNVSKLPENTTTTTAETPTENKNEEKLSVIARYQDGVIKVALSNNTLQQVVTEWSDWKLQKKEGNDWINTFPSNAFTESIGIVVYIEPGNSTSNSVAFYSIDNRERLAKPLSDGTYKYIHYFDTKEGRKSAECEFEVE